MAYHINSTGLNPPATPTSPWDTWEKAAATIGAVAGTATAGSTCYVHPSHSESGSSSINFANSTLASPISLVCGTPNTAASPASVGITAQQTTATFGAVSTSISITGNLYIYGISFRVTGASSSGKIQLNHTVGYMMTLEQCELYNASTVAASGFLIGASTTPGESLTVFNGVRVRYGAGLTVPVINGRVIMNNVSFISGTSSPSGAGLFSLGTTAQNSGRLEINGMNCTNLGTAFNIFTDQPKGASWGRARNVQLPASWAGAINSTPDVGNTFELLNYSIGTAGTTMCWTADKIGSAKSNTATSTYPVYKSSGSSDGTTAYSMALTTTANCAYPSSVYRSPPIRKRVAAGAATTLGVSFAYNGTSAMNNKEIWIEVEYLGTSGQALGTVYSSCPDFMDAVGNYTSASETWSGFTSGTTVGPNDSGSTTWRSSKLYFPGITCAVDGEVVVTICMAKPSWTVFVDQQIAIGGP